MNTIKSLAQGLTSRKWSGQGQIRLNLIVKLRLFTDFISYLSTMFRKCDEMTEQITYFHKVMCRRMEKFTYSGLSTQKM